MRNITYYDTTRKQHDDDNEHGHYIGNVEPDEPPDLSHGREPDGAELTLDGRWYAVHTH